MNTPINRRIALSALAGPPVAAIAQQAAPRATDSFSPAALGKRIEGLLRSYADAGRFAGVALVAHRSEPVCRAAFGMANREWAVPNTIDTCFRVASVTKPFTATLVLQAVEQGLLQLDGRVSDYLTDYPRAEGEQIRIHNLLSHTSGLIDYPDVADFEYRGERLRHSRTEMLALFAERPLRFTPGTDYRYSNFGYFLLGHLLERITGKDHASLLQQRIFGPLGMNHTSVAENKQLVKHRAAGYYPQDGTMYNALPFDTSVVMGAGDILSTAEDLLLYDQAMYVDKLLTERSRKLMFTAQLPKRDNYAYGWYVRLPEKHPGPDWARHSGSINGFSSLLLRFPETRHTVVLLCNMHGVKTIAIGDEIKQIVLGG